MKALLQVSFNTKYIKEDFIKKFSDPSGWKIWSFDEVDESFWQRCFNRQPRNVIIFKYLGNACNAKTEIAKIIHHLSSLNLFDKSREESITQLVIRFGNPYRESIKPDQS